MDNLNNSQLYVIIDAYQTISFNSKLKHAIQSICTHVCRHGMLDHLKEEEVITFAYGTHLLLTQACESTKTIGTTNTQTTPPHPPPRPRARNSP